MRYSYKEFIEVLGLLDTKLSKSMYALYLDSLRQQSEQ